MHAFFAGTPPVLHVAHRGGAGLAPENTLAAFRIGISHRTDVLETDLQVTSDGVLVLLHDDDVDRTTDGAGPVAGMTLAELERLDAGYRFTADGGRTFPYRGTGLRVPTLRGFLAAFPGMRLNLDLKSPRPGLESLVAQELRRAGAATRVVIGSDEEERSRRLLTALPEALHFYPDAALRRLMSALLQGQAAPDEPYGVLDAPYEHEGQRVALRLLEARVRLPLMCWTVDDPARMRLLRAAGARGIMSDRPDLLRAVLDEPS